jgi:hypothetical protein
MEIFDKLIHLYDQFLQFFPDPWHPWVSLGIFVLMVLAILRNFRFGLIGVILLVLFVPASIPVLRSIGIGIVQLASHVLGSK